MNPSSFRTTVLSFRHVPSDPDCFKFFHSLDAVFQRRKHDLLLYDEKFRAGL